MAFKFVKNRKATSKEKEIAERSEADLKWLSEHSPEIWSKHKGKYFAVVNREPFIGDTPEEVLSMINKKHPGLESFVWRIPYKPKIKIL